MRQLALLGKPAQAMILAAGRGERMRPLSDHTPKPLLQVQGKPLLQWHLDNMAQAGIDSVAINTGWLGEQVAGKWGADFSRSNGIGTDTGTGLRGVQLHYSREDQECGGGLETAGGIARALPLLDDVFWLVAGDAFMPEFPFDAGWRDAFANSPALAQLWLVPNPEHNLQGDFGLDSSGLAIDPSTQEKQGAPRYTYSTLALLRKELFQPPWCDIPLGNPQGTPAKLAPLLRKAMQAGLVSAQLYEGTWVDVGTPERLALLNL